MLTIARDQEKLGSTDIIIIKQIGIFLKNPHSRQIFQIRAVQWHVMFRFIKQSQWEGNIWAEW